ncbi:putative signal peptide protein [Halorubrum sp. AJ67]|nr:putative signal peptide protein [Halorubrum sp. AJ67]
MFCVATACFVPILVARSSSTNVASRARPDSTGITRNRRRILHRVGSASVTTIVGYKCFVWPPDVCERPSWPVAGVRRPFSRLRVMEAYGWFAVDCGRV